jgi:NADH dehydrogenase (ubiquinone) Fe-S protein 2
MNKEINQVKKTINLNFGPQHPAAHGVIRLILNLEGEVVRFAEPHIGLLHRGTEKLAEYKTLPQILPYFDRLDYVSMVANEHVFSLGVENLIKLTINKHTSYIRVMLLEITRIINHLMSITTHAMDVGALTPFIWMFEEREKLMEFYERLSGARMHANYIRPGQNISRTNELINICFDLKLFLLTFSSRIDELEELITKNRIWVTRLQGIGIISLQNAVNYNFSGVIIRSTGIRWDLRKEVPYECYSELKFSVPVAEIGDCYERYILRMFEIRQSINLINQTIECISTLDLINEISSENDNQFFDQDKVQLSTVTNNKFKDSMEELIYHFKYFSTADIFLPNQIYTTVESPKGELGVYLVSTLDTNKIYRCKIKAPGFFHLQGLNILSQNHLIADIVTIIGTQDIVFGEIDR